MRERLLILSGLVVFLALVTLPFWYNAAAKASATLELKRPAAATQCVADTAFMRRSHMEMLNAWRDRRVREGIRTQPASGGRVFDISLTGTCLEECHGSRADFCDRCHNYVGLSGPYCWDCHNAPAGSTK